MLPNRARVAELRSNNHQLRDKHKNKMIKQREREQERDLDMCDQQINFKGGISKTSNE